MRISSLTVAAVGGVLLIAAPVIAQPRAATAAYVVSTQAPDRAQAAPPAAPAQKTINLNTATIEQLETLPGIGRKTAERILEYRTKVGSFKKIEELMNVKGIGEKSFLKLKPLVSAPPKPEKTPGA